MAEVAARFNWKDKSLEEQAEYFLLKFNGHSDVTRDKVYTLMDQFHQFDSQKTNELGVIFLSHKSFPFKPGNDNTPRSARK
jgi:cell division GTPase FtsZ